MITLQPAQNPNGKLPYPFHVNDQGMVGRQDFWKGDPMRVVGFVADFRRQAIDLPWTEFVADPQRAVGMYAVLEDRGGAWSTYMPVIETVTERENPMNQPVESDPMFTPAPASAPYGGTAGYSASGPSAERAHEEASNGTLADRQARYVVLLSEAGVLGLTWAEIATKTGDHHGQVSGALSAMHRMSRVAVLKDERRGKSGVYVLPQYVQGRTVRAFAGRISQQNAEIMQRTLQREETDHDQQIGTAIHEAAQQFAAPAVTEQERLVITNVTKALKSARTPSLHLRTSSVQTMLDVIKRLEG